MNNYLKFQKTTSTIDTIISEMFGTYKVHRFFRHSAPSYWDLQRSDRPHSWLSGSGTNAI